MVESFSCSVFNKVLSIFETSSSCTKCECFFKLFSVADVTDIANYFQKINKCSKLMLTPFLSLICWYRFPQWGDTINNYCPD